MGGGSLRSASILRRPKCAALMSLSSVAAGQDFVRVSFCSASD